MITRFWRLYTTPILYVGLYAKGEVPEAPPDGAPMPVSPAVPEEPDPGTLSPLVQRQGSRSRRTFLGTRASSRSILSRELV